MASLKERGAGDINSPKEELVAALKGVDMVISAVLYYSEIPSQMVLVDAAKEAGVKRFVPND